MQTPTLAMCVEREMEILQHRPRTYWELSATFKASDHTYEANYQLPPDLVEDDEARTRIFDPAHLAKLKADMESHSQGVASETRSKRAEKPPVPYDLTSLQRATGLTARRTQDVAQALYERHKLLSYPRTDSRHLPTEERPMLEQRLTLLQGLPDLSGVVDKIREVGAMNIDRVFDDSRVTDHHAIIPVGIPKPGQLEDTELRVYMMVARHFLASLMPPAQWEQVVRETAVETSDSRHLFRSTGRMLLVPGWQLAMGRNAGHGSSLQELNPGSGAAVTQDAHEFSENQTKPRGRLTDATLLSKMENCGKEIEDTDISEALRERGLGTPATRADTIERLIDRGYLVRAERALRATAKAVRLVEVLHRAGAKRLISAALTGDMEFKLRNVEGGDLSRETYMDSVVGNTKELVDTLVGFRFDDMYSEGEPVGSVPGQPENLVKETAWGYSTDEEKSEEPFFIWKDVGGRVLLPPEMRRMLESEDGTIGPVTLYPQGSGNRPGY
ncbi:MAG: DNA topoisomerase, partial [Myxococcota bacterium]|nr:DNA topoisomerase [Myxococcota bacterium]